MTLFVKLEGSVPVGRILSEGEVRALFPNVSFPVEFNVAPEGYAVVEDVAPPTYNPLLEKLVEVTPVKRAGLVVRKWNIINLSAEEAAEAKKQADEQKLQLAKYERSIEVQQIKVVVDGKTYDGNEVAQNRMLNRISALADGQTTIWVLADGTTAMVTRANLQAAFKAANDAQAEIWIRPYA